MLVLDLAAPDGCKAELTYSRLGYISARRRSPIAVLRSCDKRRYAAAVAKPPMYNRPMRSVENKLFPSSGL